MKLISEKHPVLTCFLLVLIAYLPVVSFQFAIKNDFFSAYFPLKYFLSESIHSGVFPLWNPFLNYGFPIYGDISESYWNPLTWLIASTVGYNPWTFTMEMIFYLFLACRGMYSLSGIWINSVWVRILTSVAFACSGYFIGHLQHFNWITASAVLPICMLTLIKFTGKGELKYFFASVISCSWLLTTAHPGILIGMILFMIPILIHLKLTQFKEILRMGILSLSILIVCAGMLYAYLEVLPFTSRNETVGALVRSDMSTGLSSWISLFMSLPVTQGDAFFGNDVAMRNCYIGILLFASFSLIISGRKKGTALYLFCCGLAFVLLSSELVLPIYKYLPLVNYVRLNSEFRIFAILSFIVAGGISLEHALKQQDKIIYRTIQIFRILYIVAVAFATVFIILRNESFLAFLPANGIERGGIKAIINNLSFAQCVLIHGLIQIVICTLLIRALKNFNHKKIIVVAIAEIAIAALLNLPFTGVGQRSVKAMDQLLSAAPKGIPTPVMISESEVVNYYPETRLVLGDWSLYSKQIAMDSLFPYPLIFKSTAEFALSEGKQTLMALPPIFLKSGALINQEQIRYSYQSIRINVNNAVADSLVIKQNIYPKWHAEIDGKPSILRPAMGTFISVPIPTGKHEVSIEFRNNLILPLLLLEFFLFLAASIALIATWNNHRIRYILP